MCDEVAKTAAAWWIEQIKKRCTILYPNRIIKDRTGFVVIDEFLIEELTRFEETLVREIRDNLKKFHYVYLGCSYSPDDTLSQLAQKCEIPINYFPIHADMEVHGNSIRVSYGNVDWHEIRSSA